MRALLAISLCLSSFCLSSCQKAPEEKSDRLHEIKKTRVLSKDGHQIFESWWVAESLLDGLDSREYYVISGTCLSETCEWTLLSHMNGFKWEDGAQLKVIRQGEDVVVQVATPDYPWTELGVVKDVFSQTGFFRFRIEIHQGVSAGVRFIFWKDWISRQGRVLRPLQRVNIGNAALDSLGTPFFSHGRGARWGFKTRDVSFENVYREGVHVD